MKKKLMLSLLSLFTLVACGGKTSEPSQSSSSESSSTVGETSSIESSSSSSSSVEEKGWTEEQKKTMQDHLYGEVLPYIDVGETVVEYDDEYGAVFVLGSSTVNQTTLKDYATLLTSNGWYDASDQYTGVPEDGTLYIYEKVISTDQGKRYVDIQYFAADTTTSKRAQEGIFYLMAKDPYFGMYDFPSEDFDYITGYNYESEVTVPAFEADLYMPVTDYYDNFVGTICLTSSQNAEETYKSTLQQSSYTILEEKSTTNLNNKDYDVNCAVSSDKKFAVMYAYIEDFGGLYIYVDDVPRDPTKWPVEELNAAFETYGLTPFEVPALEFEGARYSCYEDDNNIIYYIYGMPQLMNYVIEVSNTTETAFTSYLTTLSQASWVESDTASEVESQQESVTKKYTKTFEDKIATIEVKFDSQSSLVTIKVYLAMEDVPLTSWPEDEVKASLGDEYNEITDVVPAPTSEKITGYYFDPAMGNYIADVQILCESKDVDEVYNSYVTTLTSNGYKEYELTPAEEDEVDYISSNNQIIVVLFKGENAVFVAFYAAPLTSWPSTLVSKQAQIHNYTDTLPELTGENLVFDYLVNPNRYPTSYEIGVSLTNADESNNAQSLMEQYGNTLTNASFTASDKDDLYLEGEKIYVSPNNQFEVTLFIQNNSMLVILVTPVTSSVTQ